MRDEIKLKSSRVESLFKTEFIGKFPYDDCYKLQKQNPFLTKSLIPDLDIYFSFIAGFSSSATRLTKRSLDELQKAIPRLKMSFFDMYPSYVALRELINPTNTKKLYRDLHIADALRSSLIELIESVIEEME